MKTEAQLKSELKNLETRILEITHDPLAEMDDIRFIAWSNNKQSVAKVTKMMKARQRILDALFERHCTDSEIARLERINNLLREMTDRTFKRTANLFRALLSMPKDNLDDDFEIDGKLVPEFDMQYSVLRLEDDAYYGSDFIRMAAILQKTEKFFQEMVHTSPLVEGLDGYTPSMSDDELDCTNNLDDGMSWHGGALRNPKLNHITIHHALYALYSHMHYSIPDVLRVNDFKIEVTLKVQQFSDQEGNRLWWWHKYDLPQFKNVLLKEIASRPEGLSQEDALLQRCRDYFGDTADEVLTDVGITDTDIYLEALKDAIDNLGEANLR